MVYSVEIKDRRNTPVKYLSDVKTFRNGRRFTFKPGVNIIIGENGSGKSTLMKLIESYLMVDKECCDKGLYNKNINKLFGWHEKFLDGASVVADYKRNVFRLCHLSEKDGDNIMSDFNSFGTFFTQKHASTGESVNISLCRLFDQMFGKDVKAAFDYNQFHELYPQYVEYVESNRKEGDEWTVLMDEPDRNLDITRVREIEDVLSNRKEKLQIIAVVHNPLLIYNLSRNKSINMIELTKGYAKKVREEVDKLIGLQSPNTSE